MRTRSLGSQAPAVRSRSLGPLLAFVAVAGLLWLVAAELQHAGNGARLPLSDAGVIREQAAAKHLDPALIAAVIYAESKFEPRTSPTGAEGLMQIEPATAYYLAHLSGGVRFTASDLATPRVNVAYGSYYLRYLLDHYSGNEVLALAAYNGGLSNVESWLAQDNAAGRTLTPDSIPFPETREYVQRVLLAQQEYRQAYGHQLGIS